MFRTSVIPTLAVAAVAGGSAFVTGSHFASRASSHLTLPDCAGSGLSAARTPGVAATFSDPNACTEFVTVDVSVLTALEVLTILTEDDTCSAEDDTVQCIIGPEVEVDLEVLEVC